MAAKNTVLFFDAEAGSNGRREPVFAAHLDKLREENGRLQKDLERALQERNRLLKKINHPTLSTRSGGGSRVLEKRLEETRGELDTLRKERQQLADKTQFLAERLAESERVPVAFLTRIEELVSLSDNGAVRHAESLDSDMLNAGQVCERFNNAIESMWRSLEQSNVFAKEALVEQTEKLRLSLERTRAEALALKRENQRLAEEMESSEVSLQQTVADTALKEQRVRDLCTRMEDLEGEKSKLAKNNLQLKAFIKELRSAVDPDVFNYIADGRGGVRQAEHHAAEESRAKPMISGAILGSLVTLLAVWLLNMALPQPMPSDSASLLQQRIAWLAGEAPSEEVTFSALAQTAPAWSGKRQQSIRVESPVNSDALSSGGRGPALISLPGGSFTMGSDRYGVPEMERPARLVQVRPFQISQTEVTFAQYDAFARASGRQLPDDQGWGRERRPVVGVSWEDANAYAQWLSRQTGKRYRLPTEEEWEYALGGGFQGLYWWGNDFQPRREVCFNCGTPWDGRSSAPVGSAEANRFGLYDMGGNVMEWVSNCLERTAASSACASRVVRGGDFNKPGSSLRTTVRRGLSADSRLPVLGFRLVRES
jgi:formylglycine-generating enzyme required for sulfatase activity